MRSAMRAVSQLPGKGPLMWMMPLHLHINQKSDYDMMMMIIDSKIKGQIMFFLVIASPSKTLDLATSNYASV